MKTKEFQLSTAKLERVTPHQRKELLSNLVYRESSGHLFLTSILFNTVNEFDTLHNIC